MMNLKESGRKRLLLHKGTIPEFACRDSGNQRRTSVRIAEVPADKARALPPLSLLHVTTYCDLGSTGIGSVMTRGSVRRVRHAALHASFQPLLLYVTRMYNGCGTGMHRLAEASSDVIDSITCAQFCFHFYTATNGN
jgi:hypothetical protein